MSYPTPMDVAEAEDRDADLSPSERLANICAALEEDLNESPFTREEWERMDAERLELLAANDALSTQLTIVNDQLCRDQARLAEAMRLLAKEGIHMDDHGCWCNPTVIDYSDSKVKHE